MFPRYHRHVRLPTNTHRDSGQPKSTASCQSQTHAPQQGRAVGNLFDHRINICEQARGICLAASWLFLISQSSEPAAEQDGALGNVPPAFDQSEELLVARVDSFGELVAGADLGDDILADLAIGLQYGVVE